MITSAYSQSSSSSGFNPILQKFYEMISEIIVSKKVCRIFLFFCQLSFIYYLLFIIYYYFQNFYYFKKETKTKIQKIQRGRLRAYFFEKAPENFMAVRDFQQITFIVLSGFCWLSKKNPPLLFLTLTDNIHQAGWNANQD